MTIRRESGPVTGRKDTGPGMPHGDSAAPVQDSDRPFSDRGLRYFSDVAFPATPAQVLASAIEHGAPDEVLTAIKRIPDRVYAHPDQMLRAAGGGLDDATRRRFDDNMGKRGVTE